MTHQIPITTASDAARVLAVASAAQADCAAAVADATLPADDNAWPDWWLQGWHVIDLCQQALELAARRGRDSAPLRPGPSQRRSGCHKLVT
jgi:hypothetical protein